MILTSFDQSVNEKINKKQPILAVPSIILLLIAGLVTPRGIEPRLPG